MPEQIKTTEQPENANPLRSAVKRLVILPGFRAKVYDYIDDRYKDATIVKRYGFVSKFIEREYGRDAAKYPDCVDVIFDEGNKRSNGHFTSGIVAI